MRAKRGASSASAPLTTSAMVAAQLPKRNISCEKVFAPLWHGASNCDRATTTRCSLLFGRLKQMPGFESFMTAQVVADMKYVPPLKNARDWQTFAAPGPGSKRGLNRVLGRPVDAPWRDDTVWHRPTDFVSHQDRADVCDCWAGTISRPRPTKYALRVRQIRACERGQIAEAPVQRFIAGRARALTSRAFSHQV